MLVIALMVLAMRQVSTDVHWYRVEKYVRVSFWGLNIGLTPMIMLSLFPGGVLQLVDVLEHGYWHARSMEYLSRNSARMIEWLRMPGDIVFILFGALPAVIAAGLTYRYVREWARRLIVTGETS